MLDSNFHYNDQTENGRFFKEQSVKTENETGVLKAEEFYDRVLSLAGMLFFIVLGIVFPLWSGGSYNVILSSKYLFFETVTLFSAVFFFFFSLFKNISQRKSFSPLSLLKGIDCTTAFLTVFILSALLSVLFSPYISAENSAGQSAVIYGSGRYDGLYVFALYGAVFLISARFVKFGIRNVLAIGAVTLVMSVLGIVQLFGVNIFGLYPSDLYNGYYADFISTMGNIDFMSALLSMFLPLLFGCFISVDMTRARGVFLLICSLIGQFCLFKTEVQSGMIAFIVTAAVIVPLSIKSVKSIKKALVFFASCSAVAWLCSAVEISQGDGFTETAFAFDKKSFLICLAGIAVLTALYILICRKAPSKGVVSKLPVIIAVTELSAAAVLLIYIYFFHTPSQTDNAVNQLYALLHNTLSQSSGSGRGGIWKYSFLMGLEKPVFGYGKGCYRLAMDDFSARVGYTYYTSKNASLDAAHNEFLQLFCTQGIIGLLSYVGFALSLIIKTVKRRFGDPYTVTLLSCIIGYLIQSFFTFSIVEVAPIFWMFCGLLFAKRKMQKNPPFENINH